MKQWILAIGFLLILTQVKADNPTLRSRGFIGLGYRPLTAEEKADGQATNGLRVIRVLTNGPAATEVRVGDVLQTLGSQVISGEAQFRRLLRNYYAGDTVEIGLLRAGQPVKARVVTQAFPQERAEELAIEYAAFSSHGTLLRAVLASPATGQGQRLPAVLMVTALGSPQLIGVPFYSSSRDLAYDLSRAGFRVLRFELRGFGDSDGEDYHATDFETEVKDNLAALDYLRGRPDVDPRRVFVYGHSTGGMEAALLAGQRSLAGLIVSCTIGRTFYERMADTLRLQTAWGGNSGAEIDAKIKNYLAFAILMARGETAENLRKMPEFAPHFNAAGRVMDDRTVAFWRQQLNLNLAEAYSRVKAPVLIVYGASDYLTFAACHETIRDVLVAAGNLDTTLAVIPGCDHAYAHAADRQASYKNYQTGNFKENPAAKEWIIGWLQKHS